MFLAVPTGVAVMKATFLSRFTPSMMTPEALEALFIQREDLARRIVALIRDSALTLSKHHTLLIGPRGIGKTHLISLIYHRVQAMGDLRDRLLIAWLREEEWGVTSFLDLLLRIFRALQAEYGDVVPTERIEAFYDLPPKAAERAGVMLLKEVIGNRTLLVLVENLDDLFEGLGDEEQKRLRAYLQENPFCTILATAQSLFNGVSLQTSPFYGFFRIHHLEELTLEEATRLLTNIAHFEGDHELALLIQKPLGRARLRAIHHLAGGNHRVYVIFSQFLTRESLDELVDPFIRTLDDLTPYYQARMAWLSTQQRKIVEFLCDRRHAVSVKEIAQRCFITHQTASSQLKILLEMGYVRSTPVGRESYYELREPLMRLCVEVKKNRGGPIRLFVDFLRLWYSRSELQQQLESLQQDSDSVLKQEYLFSALRGTKEEAKDPHLTARLKAFNACIEIGDFTRALAISFALLRR
jgi:DNA-binding transcriptional ArsR family regulator